MTTEAVFIYVTHPDAGQARILAQTLIEERLAACVNIFPNMQTIYRWQGKIENGTEAVLIIKTIRSLATAICTAVRANHPYECPCIAVLPLSDGDSDYLAWISDSCVGTV